MEKNNKNKNFARKFNKKYTKHSRHDFYTLPTLLFLIAFSKIKKQRLLFHKYKITWKKCHENFTIELGF